jgi:hypothetical protein
MSGNLRNVWQRAPYEPRRKLTIDPNKKPTKAQMLGQIMQNLTLRSKDRAQRLTY